MKAFYLPFIFSLLNSSCSSQDDRQEKVDKLRALGVSTQPLTAAPGTTVNLTYYLAGPPKLILKSEVFTDTNSSIALQSPATVNSSSMTETNYGNLSVYQFSGTVTIPLEAQGFIMDSAPLRSRFGSRVFSTSGDEQKMVGDVLVYSPNAKELKYSPTTVDIQTLPSPIITAGTTQAVSLTYNPVNDENFRVGWFVSGGEIKNRRAKSTDWTVPSDSGAHTLIATIRGLKSSAFSIKVLTVNIQ